MPCSAPDLEGSMMDLASDLNTIFIAITKGTPSRRCKEGLRSSNPGVRRGGV